MAKRKVLNKYFPPDFDLSKIPRARQSKNRQFTVRLMAPCNIKCTTCGEYIYKGKKFNARKEDVDNDTYLGIRIYRFYIKCTRCLAEILFKTDPESTVYVIEAGATINFMALKLAEEQAVREEQAEKEEDATNPMKLLEKRTQASRHEMAVLEALEELKELNQRHVTPNYDNLLEKYEVARELEVKREEDEDDAFVESIFGKDGGMLVKRIEDDSDDSDGDAPPKKKFAPAGSKPTDLLTEKSSSSSSQSQEKEASIGLLGINRKKLVLVMPKNSCSAGTTAASTTSLVSTVKCVKDSAPAPQSQLQIAASSSSLSSSKANDENKSKGLGLLCAYGSDSASESD